MASAQNDFSKGSVVGNIMGMAIPMTAAQLINLLYNVVDRIYIGYIPEHATLSLTGLGVCLPVITAVMAFANLFGMGGAPLCSIERDFNDPKAVKVVKLDEVCRNQQVNDGCFASLDEVPRQAFTLTIPVLMRVSQLYGMVPGKTKIAAIDKAILAFCSTSRIVTPRSTLIFLMTWKTSCTRTGESPRLGSSKRRSLGCAIRPRPMASICCCPPESCQPGRFLNSARIGKIR